MATLKKATKKSLLDLFKSEFKNVGTEFFLKSQGQEAYSLRWKHRIYYAAESYSAGSRLQRIFENGFTDIQEKTLNYSACWNLFKSILNFIYEVKKEWIDSEDKPLSEYFDSELQEKTLEYIENKVANSKSRYRVYINTQFLSLAQDDLSFRIGEFEFRKLKAEELDLITALLPTKPKGLLSLNFGDLIENKIVYSEDFRDFAKDRVFGISVKDGVQIGDEVSVLIEECIDSLYSSIAFLFCMEEFFSAQTPPLEFTRISYAEREPVMMFLVDSDSTRAQFVKDEIPAEKLSKRVFKVEENYISKFEIIGRLSYLNRIFDDASGGDLRKKVHTALHWFYKSNVTENRTDSLLFSFICLESLFSTNNDPTTSLCDLTCPPKSRQSDMRVLLHFERQGELECQARDTTKTRSSQSFAGPKLARRSRTCAASWA